MPDITAAEIAQGLDGMQVTVKNWRQSDTNTDLATGTVADPYRLAAELKREIDSYPAVGNFGPDGSPLTCNACLHAPATLLAVMGRTNADRTPAPGHVLRLLCGDCAEKTQEIVKHTGRALTFLTIGPAADIPSGTVEYHDKIGAVDG